MADYVEDLAPRTALPAQHFYESGHRAGQVAEGSSKVGWTLRARGSNRILDGFSFYLNPQGITRSLGSRSSLHATRGRVYVDDFGPAPTDINIRQLVASGKEFNRGSSPFFYTAREDVQRFLKTIYLPATRGPGKGRFNVYFHDHHFERGFEELVYFPAQSNMISRVVDQPGVWALELHMVSLEKYPYAEVQVNDSRGTTRIGKRYIVRSGDTLERIARRVAGKKASAARVKTVKQRIVELNKFVMKRRAKPGGGTGKPGKVYPGEVLNLPA